MITARSITFWKFSYVSPAIGIGTGIHCHRRNRFDNFFHTSGKLLREVPHQQWNISAVPAKGGDGGQERHSPEKEDPIGTSARSPLLPNPGSSRQSSGRLSGVCASFPSARTLFLAARGAACLQFERYFSNFVQKNRATVGYSNRPMRCAIAPVNALSRVEQLGFQQSLSMAAQLSFTRVSTPWAQIMNGAGDQFFPVPSRHKSGPSSRRRYRFYMFEDFAQRGTVSNDLSKIHFRADFIFQIQLLFGSWSLSSRICPNASAFSTAMATDLRFGQKLNIAVNACPDI